MVWAWNARGENDLLIRVRYEGQGAHVSARVFTALEPDRIFVLRGTLIFRVEEFHAFRETIDALVGSFLTGSRLCQREPV
jgi:hypothetical protein